MLTRSVNRVAVETPWRVPPVFLLPLRARLSTSTTSSSNRPSLCSTTPKIKTSQELAAAKSIHFTKIQNQLPSRFASTSQHSSQSATIDLSSPSTSTSTHTIPTSPVSASVKELLPLLAGQRPHYATVHVHARAYMVTEGDVVRLPFRMPGVSPGDVLRLNRASLVGSRDFTLRGEPFVDERLFACRAVVTSVEAEPMRYKEKTKRRNRHVKTVKSKHRYTEIAIKELTVNAAPEAST